MVSLVVMENCMKGASPAMKVEEIMNRDVVTVGMDERLKTIQDIFNVQKFDHLK